MCKYQLKPQALNLQRNALRTEIIPPAPRCQLKPLTDKFGRKYDVLRWIGSGGDPLTVADPCSGNCPLKVRGDVGGYGSSWTAPCPICGRIGYIKEINGPSVGSSKIKCRECKEEYEILFT